MLPAAPLSLNDMQRGNIAPALSVELVKLALGTLDELSRDADRHNHFAAVAMDNEQPFVNFRFWRLANEAVHVNPRNCVINRNLSRGVTILNPPKRGGVQ